MSGKTPREGELPGVLGEIGEAGREILESGLAQIGRRIRELEEACSRSDRPEVHRIAHAIRGSALNLDAEDLEAAAGRIERAAARGDLSIARELLPRVRALCAALEERFRPR